jgi:hypothetical protein
VIWTSGVSSSSAEVYEDGGDSLDYHKGVYSLTNLSLAVESATTTLTITGGQGQAAAGLPVVRRFEARFRGAPPSASGWEFSPAAAALGSSWWWEEEAVGGRTLVGMTAVVGSNTTVAASFNH